MAIHGRKVLSCASAVCVGLFLLVWSGCISEPAYADQLLDVELTVLVDDQEPVTVDAFDADYENNTYVSLRSMAKALTGTAKAFDFAYYYDLVNGQRQNEWVNITTGADYSGSEPVHGYAVSASLMQNALCINGEERRYWTYQYGSDGNLYMSLTDFAMVFDVSIQYDGTDCLRIDTDKSWHVEADELNAIHYFDSLSGVFLGDTVTGQTLYSKRALNPVAIASTTKLMTCLLAMEAVSEGRVSMDDTVVISEYAERVSYSEDGRLPLNCGQEVLFRDLLYAMMLPSSNEASIAVAEHIEGSEAAFVEKMNRKAEELEMPSAVFYNSSGLPAYPEHPGLSKVHNLMSAYDLYRLSQALVTAYPEVLEITSQKTMYLESLGYSVFNTNAMLYNVPGVMGLKSGTTNRAGYCLVTLMQVGEEDDAHTVICVLLDAESGDERNTKTELLLRYALDQLS